MLRGVLQNSEEIDENLTDDDDTVSDNESESDEETFLKTSNNFLTFYLAMFPLYRNHPGNLNWENAGKNTCEGAIDLSMTCNFTKNDTPLQLFFFQHFNNLNSGMVSI